MLSNKIKIERENVILSIDSEELSKYEQQGFNKLGEKNKKSSPNSILKENKQLKEKVKELEENVNKMKEENKQLKGQATESKK